MGLFSSLYSDNKEGKINVLKSTIDSHKRSIEVEKDNMARYRAQNAPTHYQDSGRRKIELYKQLIAKCRDEIAHLKKK